MDSEGGGIEHWTLTCPGSAGPRGDAEPGDVGLGHSRRFADQLDRVPLPHHRVHTGLLCNDAGRLCKHTERYSHDKVSTYTHTDRHTSTTGNHTERYSHDKVSTHTDRQAHINDR